MKNTIIIMCIFIIVAIISFVLGNITGAYWSCGWGGGMLCCFILFMLKD